MNNIINNQNSKFGFLYRNVFIGIETKYYDSAVNAFFWIFLIIKVTFEWIFSIHEYKKNKLLFVLLILTIFMKFILISLGSLERFKKRFYKNYPLITFIIILLLIECFIELPIYCLFPVNKIYLHTNYYRIYDVKERIDTYLAIEILENFIFFFYIIKSFINGKLHYSSIILLIFLIIFLIFFLYAEIYFRCVDIIIIQTAIDEKQRKKRENPEKYNESKGYINEEKNSLNSKNKNKEISIELQNNNIN